MPRSCAQLSYVSISSLASSASPRFAKNRASASAGSTLFQLNCVALNTSRLQRRAGLGLLFASLGGANHAQRLLDFRDGRYVVFPKPSDGTIDQFIGRRKVSHLERGAGSHPGQLASIPPLAAGLAQLQRSVQALRGFGRSVLVHVVIREVSEGTDLIQHTTYAPSSGRSKRVDPTTSANRIVATLRCSDTLDSRCGRAALTPGVYHADQPVIL